jgi:hypothetical protein
VPRASVPPKPMPPSAMLRGGSVQPAAATGTDEAPVQSADVPPAPGAGQ